MCLVLDTDADPCSRPASRLS